MRSENDWGYVKWILIGAPVIYKSNNRFRYLKLKCIVILFFSKYIMGNHRAMWEINLSIYIWVASLAVGQSFHCPVTWTPKSVVKSWWCHEMETFSALLAICAGNSPVPGEFPAQRPVTRRFDVFFVLRLNKQLSKQSWRWWLRRYCAHYDVIVMTWTNFIIVSMFSCLLLMLNCPLYRYLSEKCSVSVGIFKSFPNLTFW